LARKIILTEPSIPESIKPHSSGYLSSQFSQMYIKSPVTVLMSILAIPQLKPRLLLESLTVMMRLWSFPLQEYLLLGIFIVSFEMSQAPPNGHSFIGFKCTNKDCLRIFPVLSSLMRHKNHKTSRNTDCAKSKCAQKLYEVNENRAGSLQTSKIVALPLSGNVQTACTYTAA
jgi:hypothetical protein